MLVVDGLIYFNFMLPLVSSIEEVSYNRNLTNSRSYRLRFYCLFVNDVVGKDGLGLCVFSGSNLLILQLGAVTSDVRFIEIAHC